MYTVRVFPTLFLALTCACASPELPSLPVPSPQPTTEPKKPRLTDEELAEHIGRGRALLDAGRPEEAGVVFAAAARKDGESLRTHMWVLRAWMDQGRSDETLDALDALAREQKARASTAAEVEMAYLYGMAFARRAEGLLAQGVTDSSVQMNYLDAADHLNKAVEADESFYSDALLPLAQAFWYVQEFDKARSAAERAVVVRGGAQAWLMRGRVTMAQFLAAYGRDPESTEAEVLWTQAVESFKQAIALHGGFDPMPMAARVAEAATQLGHAMLWKEKFPEATDAYATAIAYDAAGFDYARASRLLRGAEDHPEEGRPNGFRDSLELAQRRLKARGTVAEPSAALLWWLGWARFLDEDWAPSEEAFLEALAMAPEYSNAWFYIGLARHQRGDSEGALQAMHTGWNADPASMVSTAASAGRALMGFETLLGWCATQEPARDSDAAFLSEILAQAVPGEARYWNNLGLFLRDEGERLEYEAYENDTAKPDPVMLADLYRRSNAAYLRALEIHPDDPQLINDAALMLHYHLNGETAEIEARYRRALDLVVARLASKELSEEERARFEQTKSDVELNLQDLLEPEPLDDQPAKAAVEAGSAAALPPTE